MNKRLIIICIIIVIGILFYSTFFSVDKNYDELNTNKIIAYVNGKRTGDIPDKNEGYIVDKVECDNGATGSWNNETWGILITDLSDSDTKCSVYFERGHIGPLFVAASIGETHKGVVYLDPTNLSATCDEEAASANVNSNGTPTEIKTGCMKWYVFDDSGSNYKMLLDHNTTARIKWNDSNSNVVYSSSNLKSVVDKLSASVSNGGSEWQVSARLITASEIYNIVNGPTTWNVNDYTTWFYFEGTGNDKQTRPSFNSSTRSVYHWLYDNVALCKTNTIDSGCKYEDNNTYSGYGTAGSDKTYSYWTSTRNGQDSNYVWIVNRENSFSCAYAADPGRGIRPVIEIPKSTFN